MLVETPQPATDVTATADSPTQITVTWNAAATGSAPASYHVYHSTTGSTPWEELLPAINAPTREKVHSGLAANSRHWYYVQVEDANGALSGDSLKADTTTPPAIPAKPVNVTVTPHPTTPNSALRIAWDYGSPGTVVANTLVQRSATGVLGGGSFNVTVASGAPPGFTSPKDDTGLASGATWFYKVRVVDAQGNAVDSDVAQGTTGIALTPQIPINVTGEATGATTAHVAWQASTNPGSTITQYRVYRASPTSTSPYTNVGNVTPPAALEFDDTDLLESTRYWYGVRAWDGTNESNLSVVEDVLTHTIPPAVPTIMSVLPLSGAEDDNPAGEMAAWQHPEYFHSHQIPGLSLNRNRWHLRPGRQRRHGSDAADQ